MQSKTFPQENVIERTSYLWHRLFREISLPTDGTVIEVAPGYEPKIGNALALLGFHGTLFIIEPDQKAACSIQNMYKHILPHATIQTVYKTLQETKVGTNVPHKVNALVASHPFDDMVIALIVEKTDFFSEETKKGTRMSPAAQKLYNAIPDEEYTKGMRTATAAWKHFIKKSRPHYFIASQYPSRTLIIKGLAQRQDSGFAVLKRLKRFYKKSLVNRHHEHLFGFKGNPKWWITAKEPHRRAKHGFHTIRHPTIQ